MTEKRYALGSELPVRRIVAKNFATDSENRIHSDDVAAEFGFKGGLVPGVTIFAYMTQPVVEELGRDWLARGRMAARFLKPVYQDEIVEIHASVEHQTPLRFKVEVKKADGLLCAVGVAELPDRPPLPSAAADYPPAPLPAPADRFANRASAFVAGETILGSIEFDASGAGALSVEGQFADVMDDPLAIYRGANAACHPALIVVQANQLLKENVDLGPWIHTSSAVQFFALPGPGERLSLRGRVAAAYTKRDDDYVELDLAMFDSSGQALAHIRHVAIIRLAPRTG